MSQADRNEIEALKQRVNELVRRLVVLEKQAVERAEREPLHLKDRKRG